MRALLAIVAGLALIPFAPATSAQANADGFKRCGDPDLVLVFMNPDLKVQEDGYVHASGSFFIQFQARGPKALDIETLKFSFGPDAAVPENCSTPEWTTGAYIKNYRADYDWKDGFFIPIDTCLVSDNTWAVALSAYDKDQKELVRYYAKAKVDNGGRQTPRDPCDKKDFSAPWPMVLPGDGERLDKGQGLYVEIGEPIETIEGFINGKRIALAETTAPARDNDLVPDLGYTKELRDTPLANSQVQSRIYGPAYTWDGVLTPGDVVKIRAVDKWGNVAEKVVHLGDPTIGGRVTGATPEFDLQIPTTEMTADENGTATYNVTYITKSPEGLHADLYVKGVDGPALPEGIDYRLKPNHVMMGGNEQLKGEITLIAKPGTPVGVYKVVFVADYLKGDVREEKEVPLTFRVETAPTIDKTSQEEIASKERPVEQEVTSGEKIDQTAVTAPTEAPKEAPGAPLGIALIAIAAIAIARRTKRGAR